jgi:hypothetical protein
MTMTVDKHIMEFEKKGLGNSEKIMDFLPLEAYRPCTCKFFISGKELFMKDGTLDDSDVKFLQEGNTFSCF